MNIKPLPARKLSPAQAVEVQKELAYEVTHESANPKYRLPETTRLADQITSYRKV